MAITVVFFDLGETLVTVPRRWLPGAQALLNTSGSQASASGIISNTGSLTTRAEILNLLPPTSIPTCSKRA